MHSGYLLFWPGLCRLLSQRACTRAARRDHPKELDRQLQSMHALPVVYEHSLNRSCTVQLPEQLQRARCITAPMSMTDTHHASKDEQLDQETRPDSRKSHRIVPMLSFCLFFGFRRAVPVAGRTWAGTRGDE